MKILKTLLVGTIALALATATVYADSNGKGADKAPGKKAKKTNTDKSNNPRPDRGKAKGRMQKEHNAQKRKHISEKTRRDADLRANRPVENHGRRSDYFVNGRKKSTVNLRNLIRALEKARWLHNPHDTRGQGKMKKQEMIKPYGLDKDSNREKSERGRSIKKLEKKGKNNKKESTQEKASDNGLSPIETRRPPMLEGRGKTLHIQSHINEGAKKETELKTNNTLEHKDNTLEHKKSAEDSFKYGQSGELLKLILIYGNL